MAKITAPFVWGVGFVESWWRVVLIGLFLLIFLYYPLGGLIINNINRDTNVDIRHRDGAALSSIDAMAYIIDSEVNVNFWTPNLPFFFPSYFLDNMPNYQLGKIAALAKFSQGLDNRINKSRDPDLSQAAELLQYSGTIWLFSPDSRMMPVPSASNQYRRARKRLLKFNEHLENGTDVFIPQPDDLAYLLQITEADLAKSITTLENQIRENATSWIDFKADDAFYYAQGKTHSYYLIFKALGYDYKDIIVARNLYPAWIKMLKALEDGSALAPWMVRNGELNAAFSANHLNYLAFYNLKAAHQMHQLAEQLTETLSAR